jgi:O-antigen ligase
MLLVVVLTFLWLRPRQTIRLWPALLPAIVVMHFAAPGAIGSLKQAFLPAGGLLAEQQRDPGWSGSGRIADLGPALEELRANPLLGQGFGTRIVDGGNAQILDNQWLGTLLEVGIAGTIAWIWFFVRVIRRFGKAAKRDEGARGWLLAAVAASTAAYAIGMLTYDAFSFIQVTFLLFIVIGIGAALLPASAPVSVLSRRRAAAHRLEHA